MSDRSLDWYRQAESDLSWAADSLKDGHFSHACFAAQQAAEKALKSLALARGFAQVKSHSLFEIVRALGIDGRMEEISKRLDLYYISARYPDAFPAGAPFEMFSRDQAAEAVSFAREMIERVKAESGKSGG